jgi:hypothetical protein
MSNVVIVALMLIAGMLILIGYGYYSLYEVKQLVRREAEEKKAAASRSPLPHPAE